MVELAGILGAAVVGGGAISRVKTYRWLVLPPCCWTKQKKICSHSLHKNGS